MGGGGDPAHFFPTDGSAPRLDSFRGLGCRAEDRAAFRASCVPDSADRGQVSPNRSRVSVEEELAASIRASNHHWDSSSLPCGGGAARPGGKLPYGVERNSCGMPRRILGIRKKFSSQQKVPGDDGDDGGWLE